MCVIFYMTIISAFCLSKCSSFQLCFFSFAFALWSRARYPFSASNSACNVCLTPAVLSMFRNSADSTRNENMNAASLARLRKEIQMLENEPPHGICTWLVDGQMNEMQVRRIFKLYARSKFRGSLGVLALIVLRRRRFAGQLTRRTLMACSSWRSRSPTATRSSRRKCSS